MKLQLTVFSICFVFCMTAWAEYTLYAEYDENGDSMTSVEIEEHTNLARCLCDEDVSSDDEDYSYYLGMEYDGDYDGSDNYAYIGADCSNTAVSLENCAYLGYTNVNSLSSSLWYIPVPVNFVVDPYDGECSEGTGSNTVHIFSSVESRTSEYSYTISFDTKRPSVPYDLTVSGGENALNVSWDAVDPSDEGVEYYNVLCMRDGSPSEVSKTSKANWVSTMEVCGKVLTLNEKKNNFKDSTGCNLYGVEEGADPEKCFVCGSVSSSTNSVRISGLENYADYDVAVVAVDENGNVSEVSEVLTGTPVPTTDFAEAYNEMGGSADGDYCFVATAVFGSKSHAAVAVLRVFRDRFLRGNYMGEAFIKYYYSHGEKWADFVKGIAPLMYLVKFLLVLVSGFIFLVMDTFIMHLLLLLILVFQLRSYYSFTYSLHK
ncbi:MAG: fibronectin type III domain-containing protein [Deltaproteobacteria bacterium]|nr:fibronectin type III domain-containing protein [Deltaproteobacteria bacterium]